MLLIIRYNNKKQFHKQIKFRARKLWFVCFCFILLFCNKTWNNSFWKKKSRKAQVYQVIGYDAL